MPIFLELLKLQNNTLLKLLELKSQEMSMLKAKQIGETKISTWWSFVYKRIGARFSEQIWRKVRDWRNLREESEKPLKPLGDVVVKCGGSEDGWERGKRYRRQANNKTLFLSFHSGTDYFEGPGPTVYAVGPIKTWKLFQNHLGIIQISVVLWISGWFFIFL